VYSRKINDNIKTTLTLAPSGWVYINSFVLYDKQTESLWYPYPDEHLLRCVNGFYDGTILEELPSVTEPWKDWVAKHSNTKILKQP